MIKTTVPKLHSFKPKGTDVFIKVLPTPAYSRREIDLGWGKVIFMGFDESGRINNSGVVYMCAAVTKIILG